MSLAVGHLRQSWFPADQWVKAGPLPRFLLFCRLFFAAALTSRRLLSGNNLQLRNGCCIEALLLHQDFVGPRRKLPHQRVAGRRLCIPGRRSLLCCCTIAIAHAGGWPFWSITVTCSWPGETGLALPQAFCLPGSRQDGAKKQGGQSISFGFSETWSRPRQASATRAVVSPQGRCSAGLHCMRASGDSPHPRAIDLRTQDQRRR